MHDPRANVLAALGYPQIPDVGFNSPVMPPPGQFAQRQPPVQGMPTHLPGQARRPMPSFWPPAAHLRPGQPPQAVTQSAGYGHPLQIDALPAPRL